MERAGFIEAPLIGPPTNAPSATVPPIAIAAPWPTARVSVATATNDQHQEEGQDDLPDERLDVAAGRLGHAQRYVAQRRPQECRPGDGTSDLRRPVGRDPRKREVPADGECCGYRRVEVGARDVAKAVDHDHDRQAEGGGNAGGTERADRDGAAACEDQGEGPNPLGDQGRPERKCLQAATL